jgi:hypothetical protein
MITACMEIFLSSFDVVAILHFLNPSVAAAYSQADAARPSRVRRRRPVDRLEGSWNEPRGACRGGHDFAPRSCIRLDSHRIRTMKQRIRFGSKAPGRRAHSQIGISCHAITRVAATSDRHQHPVAITQPGAKTILSILFSTADTTMPPAGAARRPGSRRSSPIARRR